MTTHQVNFITWSKVTPFRRDVPSPSVSPTPSHLLLSSSNQSIVIRRFYRRDVEDQDVVSTKASTDGSVPPSKKSLDDVRKVFSCCPEDGNSERKIEEVAGYDHAKKSPALTATPRKISFKCKKQFGSIGRRVGAAVSASLGSTTVSELTSKFNKIAGNKTTSAIHSETNKRAKKLSFSAKIDDHKSDGETNAVNKVIMRETSSNLGNVRAAIEIFERRNSQTSPTTEKTVPVVKPQLPDKSPDIKTQELVVRNGTRKLKSRERRFDESACPSCSQNVVAQSTTVSKTEEISQDEDLSFDAQEDKEIQELVEPVEILSVPVVIPKSNYESAGKKTSKLESAAQDVRPNSSFLWRQKPQEAQQTTVAAVKTNSEGHYDLVDIPQPPNVPVRPTTLNLHLMQPKPIFKKKMPLPIEEVAPDDEDAETASVHSYESCQSSSARYEDLEDDEDDNCVKSDDGYERFDSLGTTNEEDERVGVILPVLPVTCGRIQEEPLPPRPSSRESCSTLQNSTSNCYESIYSSHDKNNYESIYESGASSVKTEPNSWESVSNRDSLSSSGQQSNSLYGRSLSGWHGVEEGAGSVYVGKATSDLSGSDKSDEWVDISDNDDQTKDRRGGGTLPIRERPKNHHRTKGFTWSKKIRNKWNKSSHSSDLGDSDHHYESLYGKRDDPDNDDFDSFDSDTESESSLNKTNQNDSGVDMSNSQLPDLPTKESTNGLTKLAESAGKHMRRLRRNWSLTKNDITKSLSRMAKKKSSAKPHGGGEGFQNVLEVASAPGAHYASPNSNPIVVVEDNSPQEAVRSSRESVEIGDGGIERSRANSLSKNRFLNKFRRSISGSSEFGGSGVPEGGGGGSQPKSTFYLTETVDVDAVKSTKQTEASGKKLVSFSRGAKRSSKTSCQRPQSPPPPIPTDLETSKNNKNVKRSTTSWYTECGVFKNAENGQIQQASNKPPNTSWYAEIGLYQASGSTPSTSSAENSGSNVSRLLPSNLSGEIVEDVEKNGENYYTVANDENIYYNDDASKNNDSGNLSEDKISSDFQLRLQDEPLYQFYDAAVLDSVCGSDGSSEYEGYEEVEGKPNSSEHRLSLRPTAMQLVAPVNSEGAIVSRTLWCEIPEVVQSAVLSTLSPQQKKIQEAKFEMMTSEASYLNSLNVLTDHFITNFKNAQLLRPDEFEILFGQISSVKRCSERLLCDLEVCWQDNILLHGICDIVKKHANETFNVYVSYCENQILLNSALGKVKERGDFNELLKQLECSSACQSLTLYSFLMLPMQRITRWPLLVDAVLKRLSPQDDEYISCQYTLATLNKLVNQCNEAARNMERQTEMKRISQLIEFPRNVPIILLASIPTRWLVRSGPLIQMQSRGEDSKLTFGKRFSKINIHLFLFNDLVLVTKPRSDDMFVAVHYCWRSYIEVNSNETVAAVPTRDIPGRNLLLLTLLENQEGKTVEMLLSCNSESDKERWLEALLPPKSEDPDETLYERWDCPQVAAVHGYAASQPDELALSRGDVVNVTRKMADGWYHGERIRDGQTGWFPANYTTEIANPHVRARNLKQRYRLLAFSENYLKSK